MERLTTISDNQIRVKDVRQSVFQDQTGIDNVFKKLAEYENLGTVKELRDAKLAQVLLVPELQKENKELKHELEVYKMALELACVYGIDKELDRECHCLNATKYEFLNQARKEWEDEKKMY